MTPRYNQSDETPEGERRRDAALALVSAHRPDLVLLGRRALLLTMLTGDGTATADDVRLAVQLPEGTDPRCLGAVPKELATGGIIRRADFVKSRRPERNASFIAVWRLVDPNAAHEWLRNHPAPVPSPEVNVDQKGGERE